MAYVADDNSGLQIIDVTSPSNPVLLSNYATYGRSSNVKINGNTAYIADSNYHRRNSRNIRYN